MKTVGYDDRCYEDALDEVTVYERALAQLTEILNTAGLVQARSK